ncbi:hypothetical protein HDU97_002101 [Phlyctochytrium planicorne]|nr:hypothetical protein HDU97_002101 [Phlyctochytrium planicorne]
MDALQGETVNARDIALLHNLTGQVLLEAKVLVNQFRQVVTGAKVSLASSGENGADASTEEGSKQKDAEVMALVAKQANGIYIHRGQKRASSVGTASVPKGRTFKAQWETVKMLFVTLEGVLGSSRFMVDINPYLFSVDSIVEQMCSGVGKLEAHEYNFPFFAVRLISNVKALVDSGVDERVSSKRTSMVSTFSGKKGSAVADELDSLLDLERRLVRPTSGQGMLPIGEEDANQQLSQKPRLSSRSSTFEDLAAVTEEEEEKKTMQAQSTPVAVTIKISNTEASPTDDVDLNDLVMSYAIDGAGSPRAGSPLAGSPHTRPRRHSVGHSAPSSPLSPQLISSALLARDMLSGSLNERSRLSLRLDESLKPFLMDALSSLDSLVPDSSLAFGGWDELKSGLEAIGREAGSPTHAKSPTSPERSSPTRALLDGAESIVQPITVPTLSSSSSFPELRFNMQYNMRGMSLKPKKTNAFIHPLQFGYSVTDDEVEEGDDSEEYEDSDDYSDEDGEEEISDETSDQDDASEEESEDGDESETSPVSSADKAEASKKSPDPSTPNRLSLPTIPASRTLPARPHSSITFSKKLEGPSHSDDLRRSLLDTANFLDYSRTGDSKRDTLVPETSKDATGLMDPNISTPYNPDQRASMFLGAAMQNREATEFSTIILLPLNHTFETCKLSLVHVHRFGRSDPAAKSPQNPYSIEFSSRVVSRAHAEVFVEDDVVYIQDIGSKSGTYINGVRLSDPNHKSESFELRTGDILQFGQDIPQEKLYSMKWKDNKEIVPESSTLEKPDENPIPQAFRCIKMQIVLVPGRSALSKEGETSLEKIAAASSDDKSSLKDGVSKSGSPEDIGQHSFQFVSSLPSSRAPSIISSSPASSLRSQDSASAAGVNARSSMGPTNMKQRGLKEDKLLKHAETSDTAARISIAFNPETPRASATFRYPTASAPASASISPPLESTQPKLKLKSPEPISNNLGPSSPAHSTSPEKKQSPPPLSPNRKSPSAENANPIVPTVKRSKSLRQTFLRVDTGVNLTRASQQAPPSAPVQSTKVAVAGANQASFGASNPLPMWSLPDVGGGRVDYTFFLSMVGRKVKGLEATLPGWSDKVIEVDFKNWSKKKSLTIKDARPRYSIPQTLRIFPELANPDRFTVTVEASTTASKSFQRTLGTLYYESPLKFTIESKPLKTILENSAAGDMSENPGINVLDASTKKYAMPVSAPYVQFSVAGDLAASKFVVVKKHSESRKQELVGDASGRTIIRKSVRENRVACQVGVMEALEGEGPLEQLMLAGLCFVFVSADNVTTEM